MRILIFGNPLLKDDSIPLRLLPILKKKFPNIEFVVTDPTTLEFDKELLAIDTAEGINDVVLIDDIKLLETGKILSLHDFDLGQFLKLARTVGMLKRFKIICVPKKITLTIAMNKIEKLIRAIVRAESVTHTTCKDHKRE